MDFSDFSLRYLILCTLAVAAVYMLVLLLRLIGIKRRRRPASIVAEGEEHDVFRPDPLTSSLLEKAGKAPEPESRPVQREAQEHYPSVFGEQLYRSGVDAELQQLRDEVAELKETIAQLKAARRVSPQYNEAMHLAQRGMDEQGIANQCGISIGEAELVLALSRNKQEYEDHDGKNNGRE